MVVVAALFYNLFVAVAGGYYASPIGLNDAQPTPSYNWEGDGRGFVPHQRTPLVSALGFLLHK